MWAAAGLSLCLALPAGAEKSRPESTSGQPGLREARGKIKTVDKAKRQLVLEQPGLTLQVDHTTTIFVDGRTASLDEVSPGQEVRASYEHKKGLDRAQWIEVSKTSKEPSQSHERLPEAPGAPPPGNPSPTH